MSELPPDLDSLCREALAAWRLQAFDNVDVDRLLAADRIGVDTAVWIGRHLMLNGRALDAYRAGQAIIARARGTGDGLGHAP